MKCLYFTFILFSVPQFLQERDIISIQATNRPVPYKLLVEDILQSCAIGDLRKYFEVVQWVCLTRNKTSVPLTKINALTLVLFFILFFMKEMQF